MWRLPLGRAQRTDVGFALGFFGIGLGLYLTGFNRIGDLEPSWLALVTLAVAAGFQLVRSTHPAVAFTGGTVALIVDMAVAGSIGTWLVYSDLVYAACVYGSVRLIRGVHVTLALISIATTTLVAALWGEQDWRILFLVLVWLAAFVLSPLFYGRAVREHRDSLVAERAHARVRAQLAAREQSEAIIDERQRLARELHDVIAGRLSSIAMFSSTALGHSSNADLTQSALQAVRTSSVEALAEMRTMIDLLSDGTAQHTTATLRRIDRLVEPLTTTGTEVQLHRDAALDNEALLAPVVDIAAYRILTEALTNATNHAPGQSISITLTVAAGWLRLQVVNDVNAAEGQRIQGPAGASSGRGLENMAIRADTVGGNLQTHLTDDAFTVVADLPTLADTTRPHDKGAGQ